jgi:methionine-gamma-lyase
MKGFGGMISFEVEGGVEAGKNLIENVKLITLAGNSI